MRHRHPRLELPERHYRYGLRHVCPLQKTQKAPPPRTRSRDPGRSTVTRTSEQGLSNSRMSPEPKKTTCTPRAPMARGGRGLLQFDDRALRLELLFDFLGFLFGHTFLHGAARFNQVLCLLEAEAGDRAHFL